MARIVSSPPEPDLAPLVAWLRARRVPHRVWEEGGVVHLEVPEKSAAAAALDLGLNELRTGGLVASRSAGGKRANSIAPAMTEMRRTPATSALVLMALLFFPFTAIDTPAVSDFTLRWLMIVPIERIDAYISFPTLDTTLRAGEVWRLWTPVFLHFGVLHLLFNLIWLWEFGRRIEFGAGRARLLEAMLVIAPVANVAQYATGDGPRFGGLSGCVFGLLAYLIVAHRRTGLQVFALPAGVVLFLVLSLIAFSTGVASAFGIEVANGSHWGGFLAGLGLAALRFRSAPSNPPPTPL